MSQLHKCNNFSEVSEIISTKIVSRNTKCDQECDIFEITGIIILQNWIKVSHYFIMKFRGKRWLRNAWFCPLPGFIGVWGSFGNLCGNCLLFFFPLLLLLYESGQIAMTINTLSLLPRPFTISQFKSFNQSWTSEELLRRKVAYPRISSKHFKMV